MAPETTFPETLPLEDDIGFFAEQAPRRRAKRLTEVTKVVKKAGRAKNARGSSVPVLMFQQEAAHFLDGVRVLLHAVAGVHDFFAAGAVHVTAPVGH